MRSCRAERLVIGSRRSGADDPEELEAFVVESCARHGVPPKVTDTVVVRKVATLLGKPTHRPQAAEPLRTGAG